MTTLKCPKCNSNEVKKIRFGLVVDFKTNDYLKGCVVDCDCIWHCSKCHYEWGKNSGHYDMPEVE